MARRMMARLDTLLAGRMLNIAKIDVKSNKMANAGKLLMEIQTSGVILDSVTVPLPLADAVDNLYLAQSEASRKHYKNAYVTLKEASKDLKIYGKISGNIHSEDVRTLTKKIDKLTAAVDARHDKKGIKFVMENSKDDMNSWWREVKGWFKKK